jgi:hypothetical protein
MIFDKEFNNHRMEKHRAFSSLLNGIGISISRRNKER